MKNKNKSAYPVVTLVKPGSPPSGELGLTKRELIAAMAMQGLCSLDCGTIEKYELTIKEIALMSVAQADALLEELEK